MIVRELIENLKEANQEAEVYIVRRNENPIDSDQGTNILETFEIINSNCCDGFYIKTSR